MQVTSDWSGDAVIVRPRGDVDVATCSVLREHLEGIDRDVVVDLSGVVFMDSTGLGVLAMQRRRLEDTGKTLRLTNAQSRVSELLEMTGLHDWIV